MKTAAVIAEYNPFHAGHKYQIEETRRLTGADYILAVMSGDFVQRGAPAIYNKYIRTGMALSGGADAVIELPVLYAVSSAEYFAGGSITLLNRLGVTDYLSFGSECGDIELIQNCSRLLFSNSSAYNNTLSSFIRQGYSFPAARNKAVLQAVSSSGKNHMENDINTLFASPNNILALEYCKTLLATNSSIVPVTVRRQGDPYHETVVNKDPSVFSSASAIRNVIEQNHGPENTAVSSENLPSCFLTCNDFSLLLHYKLLTQAGRGFTGYLDCTQDLSDKIVKNLPAFTDFTGFCSLLKSKDITYSRISRVLTHILLDITAPDSFKDPLAARNLPVPYARLLGFKKASSDLLAAIKKNSSIPLISKLADASSLMNNAAFMQMKQDIMAGNIYESVFSNKYKKEMLNEYRQSPVIL